MYIFMTKDIYVLLKRYTSFKILNLTNRKIGLDKIIYCYCSCYFIMLVCYFYTEDGDETHVNFKLNKN